MKKIFIFWFVGLGLFVNAQEVQKEFTRVLLNETFDKIDNNWDNTFNADNLFIAQNGYYELFRKTKKAGYFLLPKTNEEYSVFEIEIAFSFGDHDNKKQSAGVLLMAQQDGTGGLLIEINQKKEYRIVRVYNDKLVPISGSGNGWQKASTNITKLSNTVSLKTYNKVYDLYINAIFLQSFTEIELNKGRVGLYIGADSKVKYDFMKIKGEIKTDLATINAGDAKEEEKSFTQIIIKMKDQINRKDKEIDELKSKIKLFENGSLGGNNANNNFQKDTATANELQRLKSKLQIFEADNEALSFKTVELEKQNEKLEAFKKGIENNQENGDIIINLTTMVGSQKVKIEELELKNKSLNLESNSLFTETKDLTKQLDKTTNSLSAEKEKSAKYKSDLDSLKKQIAMLNDSLKAKNEVIKSNANKVPEKEISEEELLQQMIEKERKERMLRKEEEERKKKEEEDKKNNTGG
ncbi:MAG: hypothetical protein HQ463_03895 [Bacteroidetes bacterium]|nr:hypothetical protein [Bacteroidota bacterium]